MESQPQNPEFRNNPENFHPCILTNLLGKLFSKKKQAKLPRRMELSLIERIW